MAERGGQSGNENATRGKEFRQALTRAMASKANGAGWRVTLDKIAAKLLDAAIDGHQWAIQEIANRIDGRPTQAIEHSGVPIHELTREQLLARLANLHTETAAGDDDAAVTGDVGADAGTQSV
jgi:hypothetical protein